MPKRVNDVAGITQLPNGKYLARVFHRGNEINRRFSTKEQAKKFRFATLANLEQCPQEMRLTRKGWEASLAGPRGPITKVFDDFAEAKRWTTQTKDRIAVGTYVPDGFAEVTLDSLLPSWRDSKRKASERTLRDYDSLLATHILPEFGPKQLSSITEDDINKWVTDKLQSGVSPDRVTKSVALFKQILKFASRRGYVGRNPLTEIELPRVVKKEQVALDVKQLNSLAQECGEHGFLIHALGLMGMRIGEALALHVEDVNVDQWKLTIKRTWTIDGKGQRIEGPPKNRKPRVIPIPSNLRPGFLDATKGKAPGDYVFESKRGMALNDGSFRRHTFMPAVRKLGLQGVTIHSLRHTCASLLASRNTPIPTLSNILGHATATLTLNTYAHFYENDMDQSMAEIGLIELH
ncbi:MAG: site-specific integrase [Pontimonas sp.]|nr:site-specific integrase [Pontimonas sp.]